ncbi:MULTISPECIES: hypothetical protein [unclassified Pseudomonas]|uniref:hypothetical protein n=1 Tax=unclassified Pseudomonas TaxID=196821 RepID=UPI00117BD868|nr:MULTISPECIES: hypothetical protein [unclassified Pseudomonas]
MKPYYLFIVLLVLLGGCEKESSDPPSSADAQIKTLHLTDSSSIQLQGKHVKTQKKINGDGFLVMHEFTYLGIDKIAENDLYGALKSNGYTRRIITNNTVQFKVHYYKKSSPTIGAVFTTQSDGKQYNTVASIYWQE